MANKQTITVASRGGSATILLSSVYSVGRVQTEVKAFNEACDPLLDIDCDDETEAIRVETELVNAWNEYLDWTVTE